MSFTYKIYPMLRPYTFLSAMLFLLFCACGPPSSTDPAAKDKKLILYEYDEADPAAMTKTEEEIVLQNVEELRRSIRDLKKELEAIPKDYSSVAQGETELTERIASLPDRGANIEMTLDSITGANRDLLDGAKEIGPAADNFLIMANSWINEARANFTVAQAANDWSPETIDKWEGPILRAEESLEEAVQLRESLREVLID